ncbi:MAG: GWxTD domain-containing protein [Saprospiraceae bacterium]
MKTKCASRLLLFPFFMLLAFAARALDAGVAWAVYSTGETPYLEINIEIAPAAVTFRAVDSTRLQAGVETLILLKQGDKIVNYEKYILHSPITERPETLLDVKRFALPNGDYELEITFLDIHDAENKDDYKAALRVDIGTALHLSEIQLLRSFREDASEANPFVKNGYFLEPLPFNWYPPSATTMAYYLEIYNSDKATTEEYTIRSVIERQMGGGVSQLISFGNQRKKPAPIDAMLTQMDISKLETGNYTLTVEVRNRLGEKLATRRIEFQRSNPLLNIAPTDISDEVLAQQFTQNLDEKTLRYSLRAVAPNIQNDEAEPLKKILQGTDLKPMRFFLFNFFVRQDANNPELAYQKYMQVARAADNQFKSGFGYGFESDRGRMYMKYGRPDDMIHVEDDPAAPPYEIWVYYNFPKTKQRNVKFLFYNPSLAGDDFLLLHSNARGEINNPRWERDLYSRHANQEFDGDNYHDALQMKSNVNRRARAYFEDF